LPKSPTWPASTAAPCTTRECEHGPVLQRHPPTTPSRSSSSPA
jgi:hypothetical protein